MFYQTPNSDSTILIAFAIIASIIFAFVVVATIILLRFENKKEGSRRTNDEINSTPPVEIISPTTPNEISNIELPSLPPAAPVTSSPAEEEEITDLPSVLPVEIPAISPPEDESITELQSSQGVIRSLWGIFLTTALMLAFTLTLGGYISSFSHIVLYIGLPFGTALAGTIGVQATRLEWRLTIVPVLLFETVAVLLMAAQNYSPFILIPAVLGAVFLLVMNREGKQVRIPFPLLNWVACFILASLLAFWGYTRLRDILVPSLPIPAYFYWFAITLAFISPPCIAVAWLRLTGTRWPEALLMIPSMPVGVLMIFFLMAAR